MADDPRPPVSRAASGRIRQRIGDPDARARRQRTITWILLAGVGILLVNSLVGENGYMATVQARREEAALMRAVASLRVENQRLQRERERLDSDPSAVEEAARRQLGMIRPGESVIVVQETPPAPIPPVE